MSITSIHSNCKRILSPITNPLFCLQMLSSLSLNAAIVTFEGSPSYPAIESLWDITSRNHVTHVGTSPKYISTCMREGVYPGRHYDLQSLRTILSTGSPLLPEYYDWIYDHVKACASTLFLYFNPLFFATSLLTVVFCCSVMFTWHP